MTLRALCTLLLALAPLLASADSLQDLLARERLSVDTRLEPAGPVVPGQQVSLEIIVATDRWFAAGTRIHLPEVAGLVVLQTRTFATNSSERRGGNTWVVQRWTLDLYATREGRFDTGPIALDLAVNTGDGVARGRVNAPGVSLRAALPPGLSGAQWVASPQFSVSQELEPDRRELQPGEAITRTVTVQARNVLDKMLPVFELPAGPGLATYPEPPRLSLQSNRGVSIATRRQAISYVAEQPGEYTLPGHEFAWWDTAASRLRLVTLEPVQLRVLAPAGATGGEGSAWHRPPYQWLALLLPVLLLALLARRYPALFALPRQCLRRAGAGWRRWRAPALPPAMNPWRR